MKNIQTLEEWLRGPIPHIQPLLQPVAHALLQAREEVNALMIDFPETELWRGLAGMATVGFHLQHLTGVLDRLFTYARDETLTDSQLQYLANEGKPKNAAENSRKLVEAFNRQVELALAQLTNTDEQILLEPRGVGRAQIPSTVLGLLFHAAEHSQRHLGQLLVTAAFLRR